MSLGDFLLIRKSPGARGGAPALGGCGGEAPPKKAGCPHPPLGREKKAGGRGPQAPSSARTCRCKADNKPPAGQANPRWLPRSMMRPCSSTMIASALRTVLRRCAMTKTVRPFISWVHPLLDQRLGAGVDRAGRLVQNQHRRVGHRRAGNGQQLPLALA